jgi:hypothetical protein
MNLAKRTDAKRRTDAATLNTLLDRLAAQRHGSQDLR